MKGSRIHFTTAEHGETIAEGIVGTYARFVYLWNSFGDIIRIDIDKLHSAITEGKVNGTAYDIEGIYMDWERFRNRQRK